jgi:rSAM/selenodomain-associated transferase 2
MSALSIIIPALDEAATIIETLTSLAPLRARGADVIVVDGGSRDGTVERARPLAEQVIASACGRGAQMNAGAAGARGDVLLFLHADTRLPPEADRLIHEGLARSGRAWGRFDVAIDGQSPLLPLVALGMNLRSRLSGIATGDQAMFATRKAFDQAQGFPDIALMEDIVLSRRLKRISPPLCLAPPVVTSGRRWDERGALRTIWLMWRLRFAFFFGAAPDALARRYGYVPRQP